MEISADTEAQGTPLSWPLKVAHSATVLRDGSSATLWPTILFVGGRNGGAALLSTGRKRGSADPQKTSEIHD